MFKPIGKILRTDSELWILGFVEMKGWRLLKGYVRGAHASLLVKIELCIGV